MFPSSTGSCISRHDSYDNEKQLDLEFVQCPTKIVDRASSVGLSYENVHQQDIIIEELHEITNIRQPEIDSTSKDIASKSTASDIFNVEIDKLSLANRKLSDQLQSVRNQLSDNLNRVRDFEERVKLIPKLKLELSVEKAENRDLHLKLRSLENELEKKDAYERQHVTERKIETIRNESVKFDEIITVKPFNAHRVCATSLESLNVRFPSSSPTESQPSQSQIAKLSPLTSTVGCMTNSVISRDIGVVTIPVKIPTRSIALNTDISAENPFEVEIIKPIMKNVSVQSENEIKIKCKSIGTETDSPPPPVEKCSVAVMAKPNVTSTFSMTRPDVRSIGLDNIYKNIRTRSFGTDPIKHLAEVNKVSEIDAPISLKLLDVPVKLQLPESKPIEKQKEFRSMGVQHSPIVSNKITQCKEKPVEPPPKISIRNESTDTSDLTLHIHRGVNTDALPHKENRLTNTEHILTDDKSINTIIEQKKIMNSLGINTDLSEFTKKSEQQSIDFDENQCHDCLAKFEIKQRTIIKNPKHSNSGLTTAQTVSTKQITERTTTEMHESSDEVFTTSQSIDSQSRIPRPTALISPRSEKKFTRQNTYTISNSSIPSPLDGDADTTSTICPAEILLS